MTVTITRPDGVIVEYRLDLRPHCYWLESRVLRPDGSPYDDRWWRCSDGEMADTDRYYGVVTPLLEAARSATDGSSDG